MTSDLRADHLRTTASSPLQSRGACRSWRFLSLRSARSIAALMTTAAGRRQKPAAGGLASDADERYVAIGVVRSESTEIVKALARFRALPDDA